MSGFEPSVTIDRATASLSELDNVLVVAKRTQRILARKMNKAFCINSRELPAAFGQSGDYILEDSSGGLHVCKPDLFNQIYEVLGDV